MIKQRTIGLALAAAALAGFGATTAAVAANADPGPRGGGDGVQAMIRHCTDQLPAGERGDAQRLMEKMMSAGMMSSGMMSGDQPGDPNMSGTTPGQHHDMR